MSFTSPIFLLFVSGLVLAYYSVFAKKFQWVLLLVGSYTFYYILSPSTLIYILVTTLTTFLGGLILEKINQTSKNRKLKKIVVWIVALFNLSILLSVKYIGFEGLLVPLGISFYTFQSISYVIDVSRKKYEANRNLFKFALFVSYFPQIIQGPISKFDELFPLLIGNKKLDWDKFRYGLMLMTWGFFKKLIIADRLSVVIHYILDRHLDYSGNTIFVTIFLYCIQLYADFSGGVDIAIGVSELFGISMTPNFRQPLFAVGIDDYWRRWHMSLGRWMKDYLFYPVTLSKPFTKLGRWSRKHLPKHLGRILPTAIATVIVFEAVGIWQGPGFHNMAYGLYNGTLISLSLLIDPIRKKWFKKMDNDSKYKWVKHLHAITQVLTTLILINFGRYFSRASSLQQSMDMFKITLTSFKFNLDFVEPILNAGLSKEDLMIALMAFGLLMVVDFIHEMGWSVRKTLDSMPYVFQMLLLIGIVASIIVFGLVEQSYIPTEFIYRQV